MGNHLSPVERRKNCALGIPDTLRECLCPKPEAEKLYVAPLRHLRLGQSCVLDLLGRGFEIREERCKNIQGSASAKVGKKGCLAVYMLC